MSNGIIEATDNLIDSIETFRSKVGSYTNEIDSLKLVCSALNDKIDRVDTRENDTDIEVQEIDGRVDELEILTEKLKKQNDAGTAVLASILDRLCHLEKSWMDINYKLVNHCEHLERLMERIDELEDRAKKPVIEGKPVSIITRIKNYFF